MKSFYFGSSDKPLYGVYHPPHPSSARSEGVLLCNPFGQEYMRAHRAFRQVANLLNRNGYHVMRFDYYGTGDSAGEGEDATAGQWLEDIDQAIKELRAFANIDSISLVGLRLGATLAGYVSQTRDDLERVVLWDPLLNGQSYVTELIDYLNTVNSNKGRPLLDPDACMKGFYMNGFPLTESLIKSLSGVDLGLVKSFNAKRYLMVVSSETPGFEEIKSGLESKIDPFDYQLAASPGNWNFVDNFGGVLIPHAIIQAIVNWFVH